MKKVTKSSAKRYIKDVDDRVSTQTLNKRSLKVLEVTAFEGVDYLTKSGESSQDGRSSNLIQLTCDAFKAWLISQKSRLI